MILVALLSACSGGPHDVVETGAGDTGLPAEEGCVPGEGAVTGVSAVLTDVATVPRVTWAANVDTEAWVVFAGSFGAVETPHVTGASGDVLLLGLRARADVTYRVVTTDGADRTCGVARTLTTGSLPAGLPDVQLTEGDAEDGPPFLLAPVFTETETWLAMLDREGQYVWAWQEVNDGKSTSFFGAERSPAGILANVQASAEDEPGPIVDVGLDGTPGSPIEVDGAHTDFVQLPDGSVATLAWEVRDFGARRLLGDAIREWSPDGTVRNVWSVFDDFEPDLSRTYGTGWYPADATVEDWSHVNGIAYDASDDTFLVTVSFDQAVLRIDRASGALVSMLSDGGGDFTVTGDRPVVTYPHSVQAVDGGVLVFNRGDIHDAAACSEADEVTLDATAHTAAVTWSWAGDACLLVPFLGSATRRADGSTVVDWTTAGQVDTVSADGTLRWRIQADLGAAFGFVDVVEDPYGDTGE